eukprot:SAG31_NODE_4801_length_2949_cov_3.929123_2_plen_101_part_00
MGDFKAAVQKLKEAMVADKDQNIGAAIELYSEGLELLVAAGGAPTVKPEVVQAIAKKKKEVEARLADLRAQSNQDGQEGDETDDDGREEVCLKHRAHYDR